MRCDLYAFHVYPSLLKQRPTAYHTAGQMATGRVEGPVTCFSCAQSKLYARLADQIANCSVFRDVEKLLNFGKVAIAPPDALWEGWWQFDDRLCSNENGHTDLRPVIECPPFLLRPLPCSISLRTTLPPTPETRSTIKHGLSLLWADVAPNDPQEFAREKQPATDQRR